MNYYCLLSRKSLSFFLLLTSCFVSLSIHAGVTGNTADCGCTTTLKTAADGGIYANGSGSKPGDKVCIAAGTYKYINLSNFNGTASNPITIVNCGGQVVVTGYTYGFSITASSYFRLTGTGTGGVDYGFKVDGISKYIPSGLGVSRKSTNFEVDHIEFTKCDVGIICKTNPTCDAETWDAAFAMRNLSFHDLYLHDINGEGFYLGHTSHQVVMTCNGQSITVKPQRILGLKIYNCRVDGTGWDGIQIANSPENVEIYNNTVNNFGTRNQAAQQAGILMGGLSNGNVNNNHISNGTGNGIQVLGVGRIQIYNNVVVNTGGNNVVSVSKDGIFIDDRPTAGYPALYVWVSNNTVISSKRSAIRMENTNKTIVSMNEFRNNLMVASGETNATFQGVVVRNNAANTTIGNVYRQSVNDIKFVGTNDYHLAASSPGIDAGEAVNILGIMTDKDGANRSQGSKPDAGAYEYAGAAPPPANIAPVANAGTDKTITVPTNTVTLTGSGTDSDGSITGYSWKKVNGPASFNIVSAASTSTNISSLIPGDYEFELTVTDNKGATGKDIVKISVLAGIPTNLPPTANAGAGRTLTLPSNTVTLSGSGSDADGSITKYAWAKIAGPDQITINNSAISNPTLTNLTSGAYTLRLTVTDNSGAVASADVVITVNPAATQPPVAGYQNIPGRIEGESYSDMLGIKTEPTKDAGGGQNISWVHNRDWMDYKVNVATAGVYIVSLRISAMVNTAKLQIKSGSTVLSDVIIPNTGGYQNWQTITTSVTLQAGPQVIRVLSSDVGAWFLNWFDFNKGTQTLAVTSGVAKPEIVSLNTGEKSEVEVDVFPNPVRNSSVYVNLNNQYNGPLNITLLDVKGSTRKSVSTVKTQQTMQIVLPVSGLPAGSYIIKIQMGKKQISRQIVRVYN